MDTVESRLKTTNFWLSIGAYNHLIILLVIAAGCLYSGFTCRGEMMRDFLSVYAFTLFTPQVALAAIILMAVFLMTNSLQEFKDNPRPLAFFLGTLTLLIVYLLLAY